MNVSNLKNLIIEDFFTRGLSYKDLARKYGRDETTCRRHVLHYQQQYENTHGHRRQRDRLPVNKSRRNPDVRPLTTEHSAIGLHIDRFMDRKGITPTSFGMLLTPMKSPSLINDAVAGNYDWTLTEINNLTEVLGLTRAQLFTPEICIASS